MSSCTIKTTYENVRTDNKYSLNLPSYLESTTNLNEDATLQYQNTFREFYVAVIEDSKEDYDVLLAEVDTTEANFDKF